MANILIIDDDPLVLETFQIVIKELGHTTETAANGDIGLKAIGNGSFDLVISDVIMPDKDGLEVLMEAKQSYPDLKIVIVSGGGRISKEDCLDMAKALGADAVLEKPVTVDKLSAKINELLN